MESGDLGFYPGRTGRGRGAQDDQAATCGERGFDNHADVPAGGEFIAVAEDRMQPCWHDAERSLASGQSTGNAITFQHAMQPLGRATIIMAVTEESPVTDGSVHCRLRASRDRLAPDRK